VHFQMNRRRFARTVFPVSLLFSSVFVAGCSTSSPGSAGADGAGNKSALCVGSPARPNPPIDSPTSTLPPSHDNDVGRMRMPDAHPDADVDANQIPPNGSYGHQGSTDGSACQKS